MPYDISPFLRAHLLIWPRRPPGMGLQVLGGIRLLCLHGLLDEMALFAFFWSPLVCTNFQLTSASACAYAVVSDSLQPRGLKPTRLLCPWDFPDKNTGVGCHFLLQGIFPTQELNRHLLCLLHSKCIPYCWATRGSDKANWGSYTECVYACVF